MPSEIDESGIKLIQHPGQGFFSCCTVHLEIILDYVNKYHRLPPKIDSTYQFQWYKFPHQWQQDIKSVYFEDPDTVAEIIDCDNEIKVTNKNVEEQYVCYEYLNYDQLRPFIKKYFSLSAETRSIVSYLEAKYHIQYEDMCALFYRGNDKQVEIELPNYEVYVNRARELLKNNPNIRFIIQSDETEFLMRMSVEFPNHVIFHDEIRHIKKNGYLTVDKIYRHLNPMMSKNFLAIIYLMSQCKYVICNSGNCSLWIALYRGCFENVTQFCYLEEAN